MPLTINNKLIVKLCTKAGNSTYNKGGVPQSAKVEADRVMEKYDYRGGKIVILRPIIDKLVFDYKFWDCKAKKRLIDTGIVETAKKMFSGTKKPIHGFERIKPEIKHLKRLNRTHEHNFVLLHEATDSKVIIQLQSRGAAGFFRCECNPAKLQKSGLDALKDLIDTLFENDIYPITHHNVFTNPRGIKRIDIAVDMLGVDASDIEGRYIYKNKALKGHVYESQTGRLETYYFVLPESDKSKCYWYNKGKEAGASDKVNDKLGDIDSNPYAGFLSTRYEVRIHNSAKPIANLHSFANHLNKVRFRAMDYDAIGQKDFTYFLFLRYSLNRTRDKALEMIPSDNKKSYAAVYDQAMVDIWDANKIWKGWHAELLHLGLMTSDKAAKLKKAKTSKKSIKKL